MHGAGCINKCSVVVPMRVCQRVYVSVRGCVNRVQGVVCRRG